MLEANDRDGEGQRRDIGTETTCRRVQKDLDHTGGEPRIKNAWSTLTQKKCLGKVAETKMHIRICDIK